MCRHGDELSETTLAECPGQFPQVEAFGGVLWSLHFGWCGAFWRRFWESDQIGPRMARGEGACGWLTSPGNRQTPELRCQLPLGISRLGGSEEEGS